jgi:hypothetical protein
VNGCHAQVVPKQASSIATLALVAQPCIVAEPCVCVVIAHLPAAQPERVRVEGTRPSLG